MKVDEGCVADASSPTTAPAEVNHSVETSADTPIGKEAPTESTEPTGEVEVERPNGTEEAQSGYAKAAALSPKSQRGKPSVKLPTPKSGASDRVPITAPGTPKPSKELKSRIGLLNIKTKMKSGPKPLRRAEWK